MKKTTEILNENGVVPLASKDMSNQLEYYTDRLFGAIIDNNFDLVKWLLENGASLLRKNDKGETFLMHAIDNDCSLEIIAILLKYTKDIDVRDNFGETALMTASYYHRESIVDILLKNGADTSWINKKGNTALIIACKFSSKYEVAKLLIEAGANVNVRNRDGLTPLLATIHRHNFKLAELLVKNGADVNLKNNINQTPLMVAVFQKQYDIVKLLVENGADVNAKDSIDKTALYYAKANLELDVKSGIPDSLFNEIDKKIIDYLEKNADATNCNGK